MTPLPEKAVINTHIPTGIKIYGYTEAQLRQYGADEYRRGIEDEQALITTLQRTTEALNQATKERDALTVRLQEVVNTFANEIDTFRAERDALKADAKRYRWWVNLVGTQKGSMILCEAFMKIRGTPSKAEVDQAIDQAMKGTS